MYTLYYISQAPKSYLAVGLACSRSSWSHPASSRPGLTRLLSSVATTCAFSHENPAGRQSTSARLVRQEPYENGLGGGAPGINVLCAWFLICATSSIIDSRDGSQRPNLFNRGNIQQQELSGLGEWTIPTKKSRDPYSHVVCEQGRHRPYHDDRQDECDSTTHTKTQSVAKINLIPLSEKIKVKSGCADDETKSQDLAKDEGVVGRGSSVTHRGE